MAIEPRDAEGALEFARRDNLLSPGLYAWAITVLAPVCLRGAGTLARVAAGLAAVSLLLGAVFGSRGRGRLRRTFGLHGFVALSVATWLLLGRVLAADRLEPMRAALGAVGWAVFAFGWGALRKPGYVPEEDPHVVAGPPLSPRASLPRGAVPILVAAVGSAAVPLGLAWRVTRQYHALFAHAVAVAAAIWLVTSAAEVAIGRGRVSPVAPASKRLGQAALPLALLAVLLVAGIVALTGG